MVSALPGVILIEQVGFESVPNLGGPVGYLSPVGPLGTSGWVAETLGVWCFNPYTNDPAWTTSYVPPIRYTVFFQNGGPPWDVSMSRMFSVQAGQSYFIELTVGRRDEAGVDVFSVSLGGTVVYSTVPPSSAWVYANSSVVVADSDSLQLVFKMSNSNREYESLRLGPVTLFQLLPGKTWLQALCISNLKSSR